MARLYPPVIGQAEQSSRVVVRVPCDHVDRFAAQPRHHFADFSQSRRFVAFAGMSTERLVGRVGFQQQPLDGHLRHDFAQAACALVGDGAADSQVQSQFPQLLCLLQAAGEAVHDAAQSADAAQAGRHFVKRAARVQDQWQVELSRQFELAHEVQALGVGIRVVDEKVEPAFADSDRVFAFDPFTQRVEMMWLVSRQKHRMQSISRMQPGMRCTQRAQFGEVVQRDGGKDLRDHSSGSRTRQNGRSIGIELGCIKMAMRVDQHVHKVAGQGWFAMPGHGSRMLGFGHQRNEMWRMDLDVLRDLLPPELAGTADPAKVWSCYCADTGRDDIDGFRIWLAKLGPIGDLVRDRDATPVEVSCVLPARFAANDGSATTRILGDAGDPATATAAPAVSEPRPDFPYELLGNAGRGGMGTVHVARDVELARRVALKELNSEVRHVVGIRARFIREAQITAQLDHPNVVPVYALEMTPEGMPAYTMKFVQGKTFQLLIEETRLAYEYGGQPDDAHSQATLLEHFLKVVDAIAYAHDKGVIHRDLKPANLMLGRHHEVYVMDWGLCRLLHQPDTEPAAGIEWVLGGSAEMSASASETRAGEVLGTPRYMSPEQAGARHDEIDTRSDQYALGLILYELATLKTPYDGDGAHEVLANARAGRRRAISGAYRGVRVARELRAIIERATALKPAQRYANVGELAAELRRFLRGEGVHTAPDTLWQRWQRGLARHRQKALIGILAMVALSSVAIGGLLWHNQTLVERQHLRERRVLLLRNAVGYAGDRIQTRLLQLEGALGDLASSTRQALQYAQPSNEPVYFRADFVDPARAPADLYSSPEFSGHYSLEWPVWTLAPGLDKAAAMPRIRRLANLQAFNGELYRRIQSVVRGEVGSFYSTRPVPAAKKSDDAIVVGISLGLADGIAYLYPGWDGISADFDPRNQDWYRLAEGRYSPQWGEQVPATADSPSTFPLSIPVYDSARQFLGVLSLSLIPQRFLLDLLSMDDVEGVTRVLLTDARGELLATTGSKGDPGQEAAVVSLVIDRLREDDESLKDMRVDGVESIVIADKIDPLGWLLIVVADEDRGASSR